MARKAKVSKVVASDANKLMLGKEPNATSIDAKKKDSYQGAIQKALNWYNQAEKNEKDAIKYLVEWAKSQSYKKEDIALLNDIQITVDITTTKCWMLRLWTHGAKLTPEHRNLLETAVETYLVKARKAAKTKKKEVAGEAPRKSVQDYIKEKTPLILGEFEGRFDEWLKSDEGIPDETYFYSQFVKDELPKVYVDAIVEWATNKIKEFGGVLTTKDAQIKEGYANFTKSGLGMTIKYFNACKEQAAKYGEVKRVERKPRKKKERPASVQAAKMKYLSDHKEYGRSIMPQELVGAQQAWVLNAKTRVMMRYDAAGPAGLGVKGSTINGYDVDTSKQKKLRKPVEFINDLHAAGKVTLRRILDGVKAAEKAVNGRVNKDCIIVRVIK